MCAVEPTMRNVILLTISTVRASSGISGSFAQRLLSRGVGGYSGVVVCAVSS